MSVFLKTDHIKKKKTYQIIMGTNGVTVFCFTFKTSYEDTECFRVCSIAKPSVSAMGQSAIRIAHFSLITECMVA